RTLHLEVPGVEQGVAIETTVQFVHDNLVGFAITDIAAHKAALAGMAALGSGSTRITGSFPIPRGAINIPRSISSSMQLGSAANVPASSVANPPLSSSTNVPLPRRAPPRPSGKPTTIFRTTMRTPQDLRAVFDFSTNPP